MTPLAATLEPPTQTEDRWTLQREANDDWASLVCSAAGWTLSIHRGGFTLLAEGADAIGPEVAALRSRLRAQGWHEMPPVILRPKADRRQELSEPARRY